MLDPNTCHLLYSVIPDIYESARCIEIVSRCVVMPQSAAEPPIILEKCNIRSFKAVGEPFNPEKHEAMAQQEHAEYADNTVIAEFQKGYVMNDKLLRPARVIVSKRPPQRGDDHSFSEAE